MPKVVGCGADAPFHISLFFFQIINKSQTPSAHSGLSGCAQATSFFMSTKFNPMSNFSLGLWLSSHAIGSTTTEQI
jgi:hypothetical protein